MCETQVPMAEDVVQSRLSLTIPFHLKRHVLYREHELAYFAVCSRSNQTVALDLDLLLLTDYSEHWQRKI